MCNPRRVSVTATRDLADAWEQEVCRTARVSGRVAGEARIRRPLAATMSDQVVRAFEGQLASGAGGWQETPDGAYRVDLAGGYVVYRPDDRSLEIVARLEEEIDAEGTATETVGGALTGTAAVEGTGTYYDDGWGNRDENTARREADADAARKLEEEVRRQLDTARRAGEDAADAAVRARAEASARAELDRATERRRATLEREATERLAAFTVAAMRTVNVCLGGAYRQVLTAQARSRGATELVEHEDGDTIEISFRLPG